MSQTFLWKPVSESDGNLVVLLPANLNNNIQQVYLVGPNGDILDQGKYVGATNPNRGTFRFSRPGAAYPQGTKTVVITNDGSALTYNTTNTAARNEGLSANRVADPTSISPEFSNITPQAGGLSSVSVGETSFLYPQVNFGSFDIPELPKIQIEDIDQRGIAKQVGEFNIGQQQQAFQIGTQQAQQLLDFELQGLRDYVTQARQLRQEGAISENQFNKAQIAAANKFNQIQRLQAVDVALPEARDFISEGIERNRLLAQGVIPDTIQDRAFELTSRSAAADVVAAGGFGAGSIVGQKTSDLLSAQQRLNLSQQGEQAGQSFVRLGMELNFDQPIRFNPILSTTSESITGQPTVSPIQAAATQAQAITGLTTISPEQAITREETRAYRQAELDRQADIFNIQSATQEQLTRINADLYNQQQIAGMTNLASDRETALANFEEALKAGDKAKQYEIISALAVKYGGSVVSWFYDYLSQDEVENLLVEYEGEGAKNNYQFDSELSVQGYYEDTEYSDVSGDVLVDNEYPESSSTSMQTDQTTGFLYEE